MNQDEIKQWLYEHEWEVYKGSKEFMDENSSSVSVDQVDVLIGAEKHVEHLESLARCRMLMNEIYSYFIDVYAEADDNCPTDVIGFIATLGAELQGLPND